MIEKILNFSIKNRYLVVLFTGIAAAYGIYCLKHLPIDAVPDITNNQVQINVEAAGLSPIDIEKQVTFPIENALAGIPGLQTTRSISRNGFSQVTAIFDESVNVYFARQQIAERLNHAKEHLPPNAEPIMGPISTGLGEIYMWTVEYKHPGGIGAEIRDGHAGWQSNGTYLTPEKELLKTEIELASYLRTVQDWIIKPQLRGLPGLAEVDSIGGYEKQYHIEPDPIKIAALGITFSDIMDALENHNIGIGAGYIESQHQAYAVKSDNRIKSADEIGKIVIGTRKGTPIRIEDVAKVSIGKEMRTGSATENGREVVIGTAMMLIGANSRTVSLAVAEKLEEINKTLPPDVYAKTTLNRTKLVDATIATVSKNLSEGALLVILVLFVMLGNFRAACITALVIPLAMLITSIGMLKTKISGNLMSLGALDFGLIVDGAVIIAENCIRRISEKQKETGTVLRLSERLHEVSLAAKEMIQPTVFGQLMIIIVYLPLLTFSDVEGKMFEPMAMTVIYALTAAFILSLTFVPAAIAICINGKVQEKESSIVKVSKSFYKPLLEKALRAPLATVCFATGLFAVACLIYLNLGQEFVPQLDEKDIALHAIRIPSTSLTTSTNMQTDVEKTLLKFPQVEFVFSKTGTAEMATDPMTPNVSDTFVMLRDQSAWPDPSLSKNDLIEQMEAELWKLPGNNYEFTQPIEMRFNELIAGVRSDLAVKIYGDDFRVMQKTAKEIAKVLRTIPGTSDLKVDQTDGLPLLDIQIDYNTASRYGLTTKDITDVLAIAIGGGKAGVVMEGDRRFDLVVRLPDEIRQDAAALARLPVPIHGNKPMPLNQIVTMNATEGMNEITRENGKRVLIVQTNIRERDIGSYVHEAKEKIAEKVKIPAGYWIEWGGQFQNLLSARNHLMLIIPLCLGAILLVLYSALHSITQSLLVFSGIPLALTGGIFALWICGIPFSISAAVGFIALSGIAVLNGLVMLTCMNQLLDKGYSLYDAIEQGALRRLRPVLMTALVASLGFVPMAIATGTGAEVQKPLAIVVIGGLISSTFLTLFVLPALYLLCGRKESEPVPISTHG